jgi:hypothetical protein
MVVLVGWNQSARYNSIERDGAQVPAAAAGTARHSAEPHIDPLLPLLLLLLTQEATVQGYLAEAAVSYGCSLQQAQQLQEAAGLTGDAGGTALLWRLIAALNNNKGSSLSVLKSQLPSEVTYGQIEVTTGAVACDPSARVLASPCTCMIACNTSMVQQLKDSWPWGLGGCETLAASNCRGRRFLSILKCIPNTAVLPKVWCSVCSITPVWACTPTGSSLPCRVVGNFSLTCATDGASRV